MTVVNSLENPDKQVRISQYFKEIMGSGFYSEGKQTEEAEYALRKVVGKPSLLLNSCGSALYTAFRYYKTQGHHQVILPNNTFFATGQMAIEAGMLPILCDSRPNCPSMSFESLVGALEDSAATMVVLTHIGGWVAKDYKRILDYCVEKGIVLLEDCAHAFGLPVGKGHAACWSFYSTKAVPVGDAGALSTSDPKLFYFAQNFRNYGKIKTPEYDGGTKYVGGFNMRVSEWAAAVLRVQIDFLPQILEARRADAKKLQSIAPCLLGGESNYYKYPVDFQLANKYKTVGSVYRRSDQLDVCLSKKSILVPLVNSHEWAVNHCCLPVGENMYELYREDEMGRLLCQ